MEKSEISDCNNADTGFYLFSEAPQNAPTEYGGILISIRGYPMKMQLYMSEAYGLYYRSKWYSNAWRNWSKIG